MNPFSGRAKLFLLAIALVSPLAWAAPGDIDPSFGTNGNARLDFSYTQSVDVRATTSNRDAREMDVVATVPRAPGSGQGSRQLAFAHILANGELWAFNGTQGWTVAENPPFDCDPVAIENYVSGEPWVLCVAGSTVALVRTASGAYSQSDFSAHYPEGFDVRAMLLQADLKVLVIGSFLQGGERRVFVHRYVDFSLTPDVSFGTEGRATIALPWGDLVAHAVSLGRYGTIHVAGSASMPGTGTDMMIARLTADGALDGTFAQGGIATADFAGGDDAAYAIAIDEYGRAVAGGTAATSGRGRFFLWKLTYDGADDPAFGGNGKVALDVPIAVPGDSDARVSKVYLNYGMIFAAGTVRNVATGDVDFGFARLMPDGTPDFGFSDGSGHYGSFAAPAGGEADVLLAVAGPFSDTFNAVGRQGAATGSHLVVTRHDFFGWLQPSFGVSGRASYQMEVRPPTYFSDLARDPDGRIVAVGMVAADPVVARFNADGTLDATFGANGKVVVPGLDFEPLLTIQADRKIVVSGGFPPRAQRLLPDGSPDPAWNSGWLAYFAPANSARAVALQPDGKIVASLIRYNHVVVSRLTADGRTDASFGTNGEVDIPLSPDAYEQDSAALRILPDGKIVIAGGTRLYPVTDGVVRYRMTIIRLLPSGAMDATWGAGGIAHADTGDFAFAYDMAVDGSGQVIAAGGCHYPGTKPCLARFNHDGTPDLSFGPKGFVEISLGYSDRVSAMRLDSMGRMLAALIGGTVARLLPDGRLDEGFGIGGFAPGMFGLDPLVLIQPDDRLVVTSYEPSAWSLWRIEGGTRDTTPPDTALEFQPATSPANSSAFSASLSSEPGATFECSLDGAAFAACTSAVTGSVADGTHTFQVRARDAVGNVDPTPASWTWTVDTTAPETSLTAGPSGAVASTSAAFSFSASESPATYQCSLDGAAFADCGGATYAGLAQGAHTFAVRASDAAGNVDQTPAVRTWAVDTVAPETTITGGPSGNNNPRTATFTFASNESGATFECSLDAAAFAPCASAVTYTNLSRGQHQFRARARDAAGNLDATPAARTWRVK